MNYAVQPISAREAAEKERLRLETTETDAARRIEHLEGRLADPRWAKSVDLKAQLKAAHERLEDAQAKLRAPRGPVRPLCAGRAAEVAEEHRAENAAVRTFDSEPIRTTEWLEKNDWRRRPRDESAGKEQGE